MQPKLKSPAAIRRYSELAAEQARGVIMNLRINKPLPLELADKDSAGMPYKTYITSFEVDFIYSRNGKIIIEICLDKPFKDGIWKKRLLQFCYKNFVIVEHKE